MACWATVPKPWTLAVVRSGFQFQLLERLAQGVDETIARRLEASQRTAGAEGLAGDGARGVAAAQASYSSSIQVMCWLDVIMSGAGTSRRGPIVRATRRIQPRQIRSISDVLSRCGSQTTPPMLPPRGRLTTAVFQVVHIASARTVSIVSWG